MKKGEFDWVRCPICGDPDMRRTCVTDDGECLINCVNHACASNGGGNYDALSRIVGLRPRPSYAQDVHACSKCGMPGATMHYPGGWLCPGGCDTTLEERLRKKGTK